MKLRASALLLLLSTAACDTQRVDKAVALENTGSDPNRQQTQAEPTHCDGSATLRFAAVVGGGGQSPYAQVMIENGYAVFLLDGACRYTMGHWSKTGSEVHRPYVSGTLDTTSLRAIEAAARPTALASLAGCKDAPLDGSARVLADAQTRVTCLGSGEAFDRAWQAIDALMPDLYAKGTALTGPVRVAATQATDVASPMRLAWPLARPVDELVVMSGATPASALIEKPDEASALRKLRDDYLAAKGQQAGGDPGIRVSGATADLFVFVRDALPFEDAAGLVPLPGVEAR